MRSNPRTILFTFFSLLLLLAVGGFSEISAQGKKRGSGGGNRGDGGGERPQIQRQAPQQMQRQQPQMRQQAQRQMPQMQQSRPQFQRQMPQMRQFPQMQRQQQSQRPQMERRDRQIFRQQMPQWNRQAQGQERPQQQRQQQQRFERPAPQQRQPMNFDRFRFARSQQPLDRERPSVMRIPQQSDRGRGNAGFDGRSANLGQRWGRQQQLEIQRQRGNGRASHFEDRQAGIQSMSQDRRDGGRRFDNGIVSSSNDRTGRGRWQRNGQTDNGILSSSIARSVDGNRWQQNGSRWQENGNFADGGVNGARDGDYRAFRNQGGRQIDPSRVDISGFRDQYQSWRNQARNEGWTFNEKDFRTNVYEYRQREAWRDDLLRSVISVNIGYPTDYSYIAPPQYPDYYGINYEPWYYNIGNAYYDPYYSGFYVEPYYQAYQPFDYYYSSYYYDDPYYLDDPYDDYVTYRIFSTSNSGAGRFVTRLLGSLLAYGYDQGYRDGLMARQGGYDYSEVYYDPYSYYYEDQTYQTVSTYQPYFYSSYEDRQSLSEGYSLGYQDAFYNQNNYDPYYGESNINIVSLYVGTTFQLIV